MQIYIDESGNLGKKDRYFIILALIPQKPKRIKNIIKRACVRLGISDNTVEEIKASKLSFSDKQNIINKLNEKDDLSCSYVVADKNHLQPEILKDKNVCYNYLASHLLKPILKGADQNVHIILDNHSIKVRSLNSLKDYIKIEAYTKWGFKKDIKFEYQDSKNYKNLQAADVVANAIYAKYNYNKNHLYSLLSNKYKYRIRFPETKFGT